jgi:hypothetical protein
MKFGESCRGFYSEELHNLHSSPDVTGGSKIRRMRPARHGARDTLIKHN